MRPLFTPLPRDACGWSLAALATLLLGTAAGIGAAVSNSDTMPCDASPVGPTTAARQPTLIEPPGGPIIWGITTFDTTIVPDGSPRVLRHAGGTGALIRFQPQAACAGAELEVMRTAPGPRTVTRRAVEPAPIAYVPDGSYELVVLCENLRGPTTRLAITADAR